MSEPDADSYALRSARLAEVAAPDLPYQPPAPRHYRPRIGVIGAGGIVSAHLDAYRTAGWEVAAICNRTLAKASAKAAEDEALRKHPLVEAAFAAFPHAEIIEDKPEARVAGMGNKWRS